MRSSFGMAPSRLFLRSAYETALTHKEAPLKKLTSKESVIGTLAIGTHRLKLTL